MSAVTDTVGAGSRWSFGEGMLVAAIAFFVILKLVLAAFAFPLSDEAYYWMWGRHPLLSYFDHPPLGGWVQALSHALFGTSVLAIRLPTFVAFAGVLVVFWRVAREIGGEKARLVFLKSTLLFAASPLFGILGTVAMHDYLLVALVIGAGYFFVRYLRDVEDAGSGRFADLLIGAVLLGLSGLTKYSAVFVAAGLVGAILTRPKLRPLLLSWELYAAGLVTLLLQAPTLIWNAQNEFASLAYQLGGRYGDARFSELEIGRMKTAVVESVALVSPFILVPATLLFFWARQKSAFERIGKTLAIWVFWLSALTFLYVANYGLVLFWWSAITFALVLPFAGRYVGPIALVLHTIWGGVISVFLVASFTLGPLTGSGGVLSMETDYMYGWDRITSAVRAAQQAHGATMLAANRYQHAAQLAFVLDDAEVLALSRRHDGFDDWSDFKARAGEDAIVLVLRRDDTQTWKRYFAEVRQLEEISLEQSGTHLTTYTIWLGTDFRPLDEGGGRP